MTLALGIGVFVGLMSGYSIASVRAHAQLASVLAAIHPLRITDPKLTLTHPLILYETPEATTLDEYQGLKSRIEQRISARTADGSVSNVSVYYRSLETGKWIGINQKAYFYPASLLKVPVMIAYFKEAEAKPALFEKSIVYRPISSGNAFEAQSELIAGSRYTVKELLERMIIDSDNGATYTLLDQIDQTTLDEVYTDLGINHPDEDTSTYQISTKTYALFFRILYNATYLSPAHSQEALALLARAKYADGLVAGVPASATVAHKFGEHVVSIDQKTSEGVELSDCGIIYHPQQPYLLCVMTQAQKLEDAADMIKTISKETYDTIDADPST